MVDLSPHPAADRATLPPRARWQKKLALAASVAVTGLIAAEFLVRLMGWGPRYYAPRRYEPAGGVPFTQITADGITFPVYQPGVTFASVYDPAGDPTGRLPPDGRVTYRINQFGMRGPARALAKPPGTFRVICLGDSITFGEGVREEDTYPARLEKLLAPTMAGRKVEVLNAGVQAYGTREEVAFFLLRCLPLAPDVVTLGFFPNDVVDYAETIRQNDAATRESPPSALARLSALWGRFEQGRRLRLRQAEYFGSLRAGFRSENWRIGRELLAAMQDEARRSRFRFIVLVFPVLWRLDDYPLRDLHGDVLAACRDAGCEFIDVLEVWAGRPAESLWIHAADPHPNATAHALVAERLREVLSLAR